MAQKPNPSGEARVLAWFKRRRWKPFAFQQAVWKAYRGGNNGLIHSATGSGKTLAAFLAPVIEWLDTSADLNEAPPLTLLWLTPMRALASDTTLSLQTALAEVDLPWTVGLRSGDTSSSERAKQARRWPSVLVTTPESLSLMLSAPGAASIFEHLQAIVVDEWHELMGNKRGVMVELCMARLRRFKPTLRTWGVSATLGNLDEALAVLQGSRPTHGGVIVQGRIEKKIIIDTLIPKKLDRFPWAGHLGLVMLDDVIREIDKHKTMLVFTNTRSQAELWYQGLLAARPDWAGLIALHHGSLDVEVRRYVEQGLKSGTLKCVVATSSLDLGVDFSPVERVLQIGSPKGVARLLQRAGRSGHSPGQVSRVTVVPTQAIEFIEGAAARIAAQLGHVESKRQPNCPLDLLTQHLVTLASGDGFVSPVTYEEVKSTVAFVQLTEAQWDWALDFVTQGGRALQAYPDFQRVDRLQVDDITWYKVEKPQIARRHRMNIGTIVSDASMDVRFRNGQRLGTIEEYFIAQLSPGNAFLFAGRALELIRVENMTAYVQPAKRSTRLVPHWQGGKMPLSTQLADHVRDELELIRSGQSQQPETKATSRFFAMQSALSRIPKRDEFLIEQIHTSEGHHVFCFPFEGRNVHSALAALFAYRLSVNAPRTFSLAFNDYGFELLSDLPIHIESALKADVLLSTDSLLADVLASLNAAELAKRHFREIARVAGLVFQGFPGAGKSSKQLQVSTGLLYDVFARWDPTNPLLAQAQQEVLERQLEFSRVESALQRLTQSKLVIVQPDKPTPFAFPLMLERLREKLSTEKLSDRIARMQVEFDKGS